MRLYEYLLYKYGENKYFTIWSPNTYGINDTPYETEYQGCVIKAIFRDIEV
jgi:hypothetical protein